MNRRWLAVFAMVVSMATISLLAGCNRGGASASTQPSAGKTLNVYIWSEYLPKSVTDRFTARTRRTTWSAR
jgi:spermidine/putrescine-binding protein